MKKIFAAALGLGSTFCKRKNTKEDRSVDFEGLTSRFAYKIGAEFKTANEDILLTITD